MMLAAPLTRRTSESLPNLITEYFVRFGDKPCCYDDLCRYILSLNNDERRELAHSTVLEAATLHDLVRIVLIDRLLTSS
jgi:hypothetical protein